MYDLYDNFRVLLLAGHPFPGKWTDVAGQLFACVPVCEICWDSRERQRGAGFGGVGGVGGLAA